MKILVLARHAKSDWTYDLPDEERPLNGRGSKDAPRMGELLKDHGFRPELILSSHAVRAKTTAEKVASAVGYSSSILIDRRIYLSGTISLLEVIRGIPETVQSAMIFGHNPDMEQMVQLLMAAQGPSPMPTCAFACLELPHTWAQAGNKPASLKWFIIPKLFGGE
jgi:phosphohistidine phosphatase